MRLVSYLTPLTIALVYTANVYAFVTLPDSNSKLLVRREFPHDVQRRAELISIFPTRDLVVELEQRLARRTPAGEEGKTGGNSGVAKPQTHAAAGNTPPASAAPVIEIPLGAPLYCFESKTPTVNFATFRKVCTGKVVEVSMKPQQDPHLPAGGPLKIDTNVGGVHSGAGQEGGMSAKSPTSPKSGKDTGDRSLAGAHPQTEGQGSAVSKGTSAEGPKKPVLPVVPGGQQPLKDTKQSTPNPQ